MDTIKNYKRASGIKLTDLDSNFIKIISEFDKPKLNYCSENSVLISISLNSSKQYFTITYCDNDCKS